MGLLLCSFLSVCVAKASDQQDEKRQRKFDYFFYEGLKLKEAAQYDARSEERR